MVPALRLLIVEFAYRPDIDETVEIMHLFEDDVRGVLPPSIRMALASMNIDAYANQLIADSSQPKFLFIRFTFNEQQDSSWKVTTTGLQRLRDWESILALEGSPLGRP